MDDDEKTVKVAYITKWALTKGIIEAKNARADKKYLVAEGRYRLFVGKPHWHLTIEEAREHVENMIEAKKANLRRAIAKLEKLREQGVKTIAWGDL